MSAAGESIASDPTSAETSRMFDFLRRSMLVQAVSVAARLGVADLLHGGPRTVADLAAATGAHPPSLYRLLRTLAGLGLFEIRDDGAVALTHYGASLRTGVGSARELAMYLGSQFVWAAWGNLWHSVTTGETAFRHTHGMGGFEHVERFPESSEAFHGWMTAQSRLQVPIVVAAYDFSRFRRIVDVGGGHGSLLAGVLEANPDTRGVLFDLPSVTAGATLPDAVRDRCEIVSGDFFEAVPAGGDCYMMKVVIHDWDDERALRILKNVRRGIDDGGRVLLLEFVIPPGNEYHHAKFMDLLVMLLAEQGRERTEQEHGELLRAAGFRLDRVVPTASPLSIVEAVPI